MPERIQIYDLIVMVVFSSFGLYYIITGVRGLRGEAMNVVNPARREAWPGLWWHVRVWMNREAGIHEAPNQPTYTQLSGRKARGRAWFHIVFGLACLLGALFYLENVALMRQML